MYELQLCLETPNRTHHALQIKMQLVIPVVQNEGTQIVDNKS